MNRNIKLVYTTERTGKSLFVTSRHVDAYVDANIFHGIRSFLIQRSLAFSLFVIDF